MKRKILSLFLLAALLAATVCSAACGPNPGPDEGDGGNGEVKSEPKYVGLCYSPWFPPQSWAEGKVWGTPLLGKYNSADREIITSHAGSISSAGVDFIMLDWTNGLSYVNGTNDGNIYYIEDVATPAIFETFKTLDQKPKIVIALGCFQAKWFLDGTFQRKLDYIYETYLSNPEYEDLYFKYDGKPLVTCFTGAQSCISTPEAFEDDRVTMRYFCGFTSDQPSVLKPGTTDVSEFLWSWWDRGRNTHTERADGKAECMTISAAWKSETGWCHPDGTPREGTVGRRNGDTFREQWDLAIKVNPQIVLVNSFNEWVGGPSFSPIEGNDGEEYNAEYSNDLEASEEWGTLYMDILKQKISEYRLKPY